MAKKVNKAEWFVSLAEAANVADALETWSWSKWGPWHGQLIWGNS